VAFFCWSKGVFQQAGKLRELVAEHAAEERALGELLMLELYSFVGEGWEQEDDITLLTLRRFASLS
jgi:hypothetical protein